MEFIKDYNKIAIHFEEKRYSYKELINISKNYSSLLTIKKEDRVVIFMENRPELLFAFLGIWDKKGTCVCLDASSKQSELKYFLQDCIPKYIFVSNTTLQIAENTINQINENIIIINVDDFLPSNTIEDEKLIITAPSKNSVALILYTSGTTGEPKGVMLTFDNILVNIEGLEKYQMFKSSDRILALLPMHHIFPLLGSGILPLHQGATIVFLKELSSKAMLNSLNKHKITMMIGVPRIWEMLHNKIMLQINSSKITKYIFKFCKNIKNQQIKKIIFKKIHKNFGGHIRFFVSGGSKLNSKITKDFQTFGIDICEGYGLTETAPMIAFTPVDEVVPGSAGKIMSGVKVLIANDGEILVKGRNLMKGYFNKPDETNKVIDKNGWFHTGDLGELKNNYLFVTGRKKEMIVLSNGKNINPVSIEQSILNNTDLIEEIAIIDYNSILTAVIFPNFKKIKEYEVTNIIETLKTKIIDKYNKGVQNYKKILDLKIVQTELPKTKLGKLRRFMINDFISNKIEKKQDDNFSTFKEYEIISNYLKNIKQKNILSTDHLELDLGLDSLDLIEFIAFVETSFGLYLTEDILIKNPTVMKIALYLKENSKNISVKNIDWKSILEKKSYDNLPKNNYIGQIIKTILKIPFSTYIKIKKEGTENIVIKKPTIFIANHQSFLDGFIFSQALNNKILNNTYYLAKVAHFEHNTMKYIAEHSNVILIDINKKLSETLQCMATALRDGKNITIFPEGTRSRDGKIKPFKKFYAILAKELNADIIPFAIKGAYKLFPPHKNLPKSGKVQIKFFNKIDSSQLTVDEIVSQNYNQIKQWINI